MIYVFLVLICFISFYIYNRFFKDGLFLDGVGFYSKKDYFEALKKLQKFLDSKSYDEKWSAKNYNIIKARWLIALSYMELAKENKFDNGNRISFKESSLREFSNILKIDSLQSNVHEYTSEMIEEEKDESVRNSLRSIIMSN